MLPQEITDLRTKMGWSMSRLAQELGVKADLIVDWESGERFPTKKHDDALTLLRSQAESTTLEK